MKKWRNGKLNNSGISLVEIIIVFAIMGIIAGAVLLSTTVATDKQVSSCAEKLASSLEQTRNLVMGKQSGLLRIWQVSGDYVYIQMYMDGDYIPAHPEQNAFSDEVAIGKQGVTITWTNGTDSGNLNAGEVLMYFERNGSVDSDHGNHVTEFTVTNGRRTILVKVDQFTGRVDTERIS